MKTVYDHFVSFATSYLANEPTASLDEVIRGIEAFLQELDIYEEQDPDGLIARRELIRFRMMPPETFSTFFEHYELRSQIMQFRRECQILAINRIKQGVTISIATKTNKLAEYYELVSNLVVDKRYTSWLDDISVLIKIDLNFATGESNMISRDIAEWLEQSK